MLPISFLISMIGLFSLSRTLYDLPITKTNKVFIGLGFLTTLFVFSTRIHPAFVIGFTTVLFLLFPHAHKFYLSASLDKHLTQFVPEFVDSLVLNIKSGLSIRDSIRSACQFFPENIRSYAAEALESVQFSYRPLPKNKKLAELISELRKIDQTPDNALLKLESWRSTIRIIKYFRHKSGQVTLQTHIQAGILSAMYLPLLTYNLFIQTHLQAPLIVCSSVFLFAIGCFFVFRRGKKTRWRI